MRKRIFIAFTAACLLLTGCSSGVSQEEYDTLSSEYTNLKEKYDSLSRDFETVQNEYNSKREEYIDLHAEYIKLLAQIQDKTDEEAVENDDPTIIYDDEYVTLSYLGFGKGAAYPFENRLCLILSVNNKTDAMLDFLPQSIAFDGTDVGKLLCYDSISPHSSGKIFLLKMSSTDNFENTSPTRISGSIAIEDSSNIGLFGSNYWNTISFIDVDL